MVAMTHKGSVVCFVQFFYDGKYDARFKESNEGMAKHGRVRRSMRTGFCFKQVYIGSLANRGYQKYTTSC